MLYEFLFWNNKTNQKRKGVPILSNAFWNASKIWTFKGKGNESPDSAPDIVICFDCRQMTNAVQMVHSSHLTPDYEIEFRVNGKGISDWSILKRKQEKGNKKSKQKMKSSKGKNEFEPWMLYALQHRETNRRWTFPASVWWTLERRLT